MASSTLKSMAIRQAQKHIMDVQNVGDMPYDLIAPIISSIKNAQQLLNLQHKSPHLTKHTGEKWLQLIKQDITSWSRNLVYPEREEDWWIAYRDCKALDSQQKAQAQAVLVQEYADYAAKSVNNQPQIVHVYPRLPRDAPNYRFAKRRLSGKPVKQIQPAKPSSSITQKVLKDTRVAMKGRSVKSAAAKPIMRAPRKAKTDTHSNVVTLHTIVDGYIKRHSKELSAKLEQLKEAEIATVYNRVGTVTEEKNLDIDEARRSASVSLGKRTRENSPINDPLDFWTPVKPTASPPAITPDQPTASSPSITADQPKKPAFIIKHQVVNLSAKRQRRF